MALTVALVEYLNTLPFSEGMRLTGFDHDHHVVRAIPSMCARLFREGKADVALCPVGALHEMPSHQVLGSYCIGADGPVRTVVLMSRVPLDEIREVHLDAASRTSNVLLQILSHSYWKKDWTYLPATDTDHAESQVVIGDRVFQMEAQYAYRYDLAEAWKEWTGLPMVFAVWIAKKEVESHIAEDIDRAFEAGWNAMENNDVTLLPWQKEYLHHSISFRFDIRKQEALTLFSHKRIEQEKQHQVYPHDVDKMPIPGSMS